MLWWQSKTVLVNMYQKCYVVMLVECIYVLFFKSKNGHTLTQVFYWSNSGFYGKKPSIPSMQYAYLPRILPILTDGIHFLSS